MKAIRQRRYTPALLEGSSVKVPTGIEVIYMLQPLTILFQVALPKIGGFLQDSVGFCIIAPINIVLFRLLVKLNAVISIKSQASCGTLIAGMRFAL